MVRPGGKLPGLGAQRKPSRLPTESPTVPRSRIVPSSAANVYSRPSGVTLRGERGLATGHVLELTEALRLGERVGEVTDQGRNLVATQFALHPRTLQRRLAAEGTTFADLVDHLRRDMAVRYLRDTDLGLDHLSRELGYAEQSVLTRSCRRWFGQRPAAERRMLRR